MRKYQRSANLLHPGPFLSLNPHVQNFLQYAAIYRDAKVTYNPSDVRLIIWSNSSNFSESRVRSRVGGLTIVADPATTGYWFH